MPESDDRMMEILRILNEQEDPTGSKIIADKLKNKGFNLGERAVRYHMKILDEKGYTKRIGYSGRRITELGKEKLDKGLVYEQVDFVNSKIKEMIYLTNFSYMNQKGNVVINTATIYDEEAINIMKYISDNGLSVSHYFHLNEIKNEDEIEIQTICGTTIDGILLNEKIPSQPLYGGLLKIKDYHPDKFTELISYKKTSITPLEAFITPGMTSILDIIDNGNGYIPANFRLIPSISRKKAINIFENLKKIGISGIIEISEDGEDTLGIPVPQGMVGIVIVGGITPFCAIQESNHQIDIKKAEEIQNFEKLSPLSMQTKKILKNCNKNQTKVPSLLSKSWNLIQQVNFDVKTKKGDIISNVSYIKKDQIDSALSIMKETYNNNLEYVNPYYKIIKHPHDDDKIGIATICSLSIDGLLINNGIMSTPQYGGLLELNEHPLFIDLISYNSTSIDPHKIFLAKNMTSITENTSTKKILASLKEIPYVSRDKAIYYIDILEKIGFSIYKIGKPRELIYNAKVDKYNFGVVTGSGLNLICSIKEKGINIDVKAIEKLMPFEKMDKL